MTRSASDGTIWIVEDDDDHRLGLCDLLDAAGHAPRGFAEALAALAAMDAGEVPQVILSDLRMPGLDGMGLLRALRERGCPAPLVMLTGHGDVGQAVQAMQLGAQDFLEKPYDADHLLSVVARCLDLARLVAENARLRSQLQARTQPLIGSSTALTQVRDTLRRIAPLEVDVIVQGETGTGKDLAARWLHHLGPRGSGPFVSIACAALFETGFEADLFGQTRPDGSVKPGRLEQAQGGTLFLDQIDLMPLALQPRLLQVLQTRRIERPGDAQGTVLDVRVIASASQPLREAIAQRRFRQDLFYRLAGVEVQMPALREIPGDIPDLYNHFLRQAAERHGMPLPEVTFADRKALQRQGWPGNGHELRQAAQRRVLGLAASGLATLGAVPATLPEKVAQFEALEIARMLDQCNGNTAAAAARLGIPRRTLNAKIARSGLRPVRGA